MQSNAENIAAIPTVVGIDIGKDVFHVVGVDADGKIAFRRKIKRLALTDTFRKLPPCVVGMEACLSRIRQPHAAPVRARAADHPRDLCEALREGAKERLQRRQAIAEAALQPNLPTVKEKTQDQFDLQACHRVRSRLVSRRTATINQIRAFLIEQGIAVGPGARALRNSLFEILKNRADEDSTMHERSDRRSL